MQLLIAIALIIAGALIGWLFATLRQRQAGDQHIRLQVEVETWRKQFDESQQQLKILQREKEQLLGEIASIRQQAASLTERLEQRSVEMAEMKKTFATEFENLANRIFEEKGKKFTEQNRDQLDQVLNPFKEKLKDFEKKVDDVYKEENKERINLKAELKQLSDLNRQLTSEANNLATALKGDNKAQGNWGELVLEKILERSGLKEGEEYQTQVVTENAAGDRIKPDVVVFLPDNKHIIIDSKVSLVAYNQMIAAQSDDERLRFMKAHADSVRNHVKLLGEKNYQTSTGTDSPDFVLLFMPIEPALGAALQHDTELFLYAWDRKIVIVSPSTLIATLRTIASIWKQERQTRNAFQIAEEGGKLYDKFKGFVDDLVQVGRQMDGAKAKYEEAMNKLISGRGNLVSKAEIMRKLGARTTKQLDRAIVERAEDIDDLPEPSATN
ncbi:MAG: DNA recombination protein RmuC [Flavobacteriales bacterium]|nr:DNA recombination protein RmuC [Flavobacteriales bacterium]